ncbi:MAG: hypothetical protein DRP78_03820 [Candidatus Omnitrophota bacterium]|nr:MAG: hypothetical protein DRP78_03820 [Candidatus Omnitrophota bacterium]
MRNTSQRYEYFLDPGYIAVNDKPTLFCSVCGNGIIIVIWDKIKHSGGMAHCIFPKKQKQKEKTNYQADVALPMMINKMLALKSVPRNMEAQVLGGGNFLGFSAKRANQVIRVIKKILDKFGIAIVSCDTGGIIGRKVMFDTFSGDVIVIKTKKVRSTDWAPEHLIGQDDRV